MTLEERMVSMGVARTLNEARELVTAAGCVGIDLAEKIQGARILPDLAIIRAQLSSRPSTCGTLGGWLGAGPGSRHVARSGAPGRSGASERERLGELLRGRAGHA